jgi:hypothetical protein
VIDLPAGFTADPLADGDVDAVVALVRGCELHDSGEAMYERADLIGDLVGADRARDAIALMQAADSNTGALPFYQRLGMGVTRSFTHWAIPLGGGGATS